MDDFSNADYIELTEGNFQLFEDLCEIIDNKDMFISDNSRELLKECVALLLAKDYTVKFGPEDISGIH